jgi:hypothetical protein
MNEDSATPVSPVMEDSRQRAAAAYDVDASFGPDEGTTKGIVQLNQLAVSEES